MEEQKQQVKGLDIIGEFNAGIFADLLTRAMREVALGVVTTGKKGTVVMTLDMKQIGESDQVAVTHTLKFVRPTERGKQVEDNTTSTPMHVLTGGVLAIAPERQRDLFPKVDAG